MPFVSSRYKQLDQWLTSDFQFDLLYPPHIQKLARKHWTPLNIIRMATDFLVLQDGVKILDVGSGVGKFCLAGSCFNPSAFFDGVEQRKSLVEDAKIAQDVLGVSNVKFFNCNFTQIDFSGYDHFYFYNSFFENIDSSDKIDDSIQYSMGLYNYYCDYLYKELEKMPSGTRVVTYCSWGYEIPPSYCLINAEISGVLKFYVKK